MTKIEQSAPASLPTEQPESRSLIRSMADQYGMNPVAFKRTIERTIMSPDATQEELAAFLMVADKYNLNPITREIYAFPKKGGGVQPIVGIDGWMNLMNSHPAMDGIHFDDVFDGGNIVSVTCTVYRKDRSRPTVITEYLNECQRGTDPWKKWPTRMLRHKAAIQCARYAFGFSGIMEPDEYERGDLGGIEDAIPLTVLPKTPPSPFDEPTDSEATPEQAAPSEDIVDVDVQEVDQSGPGPIPKCLDRREKGSKHEGKQEDSQPEKMVEKTPAGDPAGVEVVFEASGDDGPPIADETPKEQTKGVEDIAPGCVSETPGPGESGFDLELYREEIENRLMACVTLEDHDEIMDQVREELYPHVPDATERVFDHLDDANRKRIKLELED